MGKKWFRETKGGMNAGRVMETEGSEEWKKKERGQEQHRKNRDNM